MDVTYKKYDHYKLYVGQQFTGTVEASVCPLAGCLEMALDYNVGSQRWVQMYGALRSRRSETFMKRINHVIGVQL